MTNYKIELVITDNRFVEQSAFGSNVIRKTIHKGAAKDDSLALYEAELICGKLENSTISKDIVGRRFRTWVRSHSLHSEYKFTSTLVVTFKSELNK